MFQQAMHVHRGNYHCVFISFYKVVVKNQGRVIITLPISAGNSRETIPWGSEGGGGGWFWMRRVLDTILLGTPGSPSLPLSSSTNTLLPSSTAIALSVASITSKSGRTADKVEENKLCNT